MSGQPRDGQPTCTVAGDFNRHHPMWDKSHNVHLFMWANLDKAQLLIDAITELGLHMILLKDLPALCMLATGNHTRPDNVFTSSMLANTVIRCSTVPEEHPARSDHIPVVTWIDMELTWQPERPRPNYRSTDWHEFREELAIRLEGLEVGDILQSEGKLHDHLDRLMHIITDVVDVKVSKAKPSPYTKHWWSQELTDSCWEMCRLVQQAHKRREDASHPIHYAHKTKINSYGEMIKCPKRRHWENFLETIDDKMVWTAHWYMSGEPTDGRKVRVPTLKARHADGRAWEAESNADKSRVLQETFFLKPPAGCAQEDNDGNANYPDPKFSFAHIWRAIARLGPFKALGADGIMNIVFIQCTGLQVRNENRYVYRHCGAIRGALACNEIEID